MQFIFKLLLSTLKLQLIEPLRYKLKFYQVAILLYIDDLLTLVNSKYDFLKEKLAEQKIKLKILKFEQSQFKYESYEKLKDFKLLGYFIRINLV